MIEETEAVVLRSMNYGDTSKIVTVYSKKFGKIRIIAKGARNPKGNTFGSSLEAMTHSSIVLYKKEHRDLHLLSKSEIVRHHNRLQGESEKLFTGLALIELVDMAMHDEAENETVFTLLIDSLRAIDEAVKNSINVFIAFQLRLFENFGFGLSLASCERCGRNAHDHEFPFVLLRLSDGKFVCSACSEGTNAGGVRISGGILRSLHFLQTSELSKTVSLQLSSSSKDEILDVVQSYLRYHIEGSRTLRSLSLLYSNR
ncbi:MAG: DNA repair protein RecO [Bacteroidota bacterium]|jgi:DNA repair protein RecO (recombination protein O)